MGGIVTHPQVPGDASVAFSAPTRRSSWVINRRSARTRAVADVVAANGKGGGTAESRVEEKCRES